MIKIIKHDLGNITAVYTIIDDIATFTIVPKEKSNIIDNNKLTLKGEKYNLPDPLIQVHVFGDKVNRQYSAGQTMRNSQSSYELKYCRQKELVTDNTKEIITYLEREDGQKAEHHVVYKSQTKYLNAYTVYINDSDNDIVLEMLSSFSLGSITPFVKDNPVGKIILHRLRSQWSAEAFLESFECEKLLMEPSWMNYGVRGERFGQRGSFPARPFMPFAGITDTKNNITWAANIGCPSSWQMEFYLAQNSVNLSGGLADFEFGHWRKILKKGQKLITPTATITVISGDIDEAAQILTQKQKEYKILDNEKSLPIFI